MPLTDHQGDTGGRAMPERKTRQDAGWAAGSSETVPDMFAQIRDEIASLREENGDLRGRVRRLEARSGRGIMHPSDFSDGVCPRSA